MPKKKLEDEDEEDEEDEDDKEDFEEPEPIDEGYEEDEEEDKKPKKKKGRKKIPKNWLLQKSPEVYTVINPKTNEIIAQALNKEDLELQLLIIAAQKATEIAISMN